jgi:hypothetical protein
MVIRRASTKSRADGGMAVVAGASTGMLSGEAGGAKGDVRGMPESISLGEMLPMEAWGAEFSDTSARAS